MRINVGVKCSSTLVKYSFSSVLKSNLYYWSTNLYVCKWSHTLEYQQFAITMLDTFSHIATRHFIGMSWSIWEILSFMSWRIWSALLSCNVWYIHLRLAIMPAYISCNLGVVFGRNNWALRSETGGRQWIGPFPETLPTSNWTYLPCVCSTKPPEQWSHKKERIRYPALLFKQYRNPIVIQICDEKSWFSIVCSDQERTFRQPFALPQTSDVRLYLIMGRICALVDTFMLVGMC